MSREFRPGNVAMVAYDGQPERLMLRAEVERVDGPRACWIDHAYRIFEDQNRVQSARPLVVIDPAAIFGAHTAGEDSAARLATFIREVIRWNGPRVHGGNDHLRALAEQIESHIPTPKPEEPTGLGAVVEDAEGVRWTRVEAGDSLTRNPWYPADDADKQPADYADIAAVLKLAEGIR